MRPRSPVRGFNHNTRYHGRVYHVQTEDSGIQKAHVYTHLFVGGTIISTKKSNYDAALAEDDIKKIMQAQHKAVLKSLLAGDHDERIVAIFGTLDAPAEEAAAPEDIERTEPIAQVSEEELTQVGGPVGFEAEVTLHEAVEPPAAPPRIAPPIASPGLVPPAAPPAAPAPVASAGVTHPRPHPAPPPPAHSPTATQSMPATASQTVRPRIWARKVGTQERPFETTGEFRVASEIVDRAAQEAGDARPAPAPVVSRPATGPTSEGVVVARPIVVGTGAPVIAPSRTGGPGPRAPDRPAAPAPETPPHPQGQVTGSYRSIPHPAQRLAQQSGQVRPPPPPPPRSSVPPVPSGARATGVGPKQPPPAPPPAPEPREPGLDEIILDYLTDPSRGK